MKKLTLLSILSTLSVFAWTQEPSVEKSIFNVQTNILGLWINHDAKLSNQVALRSEVGLLTDISFGERFDVPGIAYVLSITLEPRWYYNLNKRSVKSKDITLNSGNFIALSTLYFPGVLVVSSYDTEPIQFIDILPTWGIRRHLGRNFNYEIGLGLGMNYTFTNQIGYDTSSPAFAARIHLRLGYSF